VSSIVVQSLRAWTLVIPLRRRVTHAAADRGVADPIVVSVEFSDGTIGYGETHARSYVTGETIDDAVTSIRQVFVPALTSFRASSFPEALEAMEALPWHDGSGRRVPAARAAVELALLDAALRSFRRRMDDVVSWMGLVGFGSPGSVATARFSGVLSGASQDRTLRELRRMRWRGLRDVKVHVGLAEDRQRIEVVTRSLRRSIAAGRSTVRVDANGAWTFEHAMEWLQDMKGLPIHGLEQPLSRDRDADLPRLREAFDGLLIHDESLQTEEDARRLIDLGIADVFNIRISKCGGLMPSLRLAALARRENVRIQLGCMTGETSLLTAAGLRFLEACPAVLWCEGCFGTDLLTSDIVSRSVRFRFGGRPPIQKLEGMGVDVEVSLLDRLREDEPFVQRL